MAQVPNAINHRDVAEYMAAFNDCTALYFQADGADACTEEATRLIHKFNRDHPQVEDLTSTQLAWYRGLEMAIVFATEGRAFNADRTTCLNERREATDTISNSREVIA